MKFGASTLMKGRVEDFFDGAKDSFEAVEIVCDTPYATPGDINTRFLQSVRKALGVEYTVHAPFTATDIGSLDDSVRRDSVRRVLEAIEVGCAIEASIIVVHPAFGSRGSIEERERITALEKESLDEINALARSRGTKVCLENMPSSLPFVDRSLASGVIHLVEGLEGAGVTFDVGHANTTTVLPEKMLEHFGSGVVAHVHAHDNRGVKDDHLEIGKGKIHWREVAIRLVSMQYEGIVMDESLSLEAAKRGVRFLKKIFEEVGKLDAGR